MILKCIYFWFAEKASTSSASNEQPTNTPQKADDVFQKYLQTRKIVMERERQKQLEEGIKHHRFLNRSKAFINPISYYNFRGSFERSKWSIKIRLSESI